MNPCTPAAAPRARPGPIALAAWTLTALLAASLASPARALDNDADDYAAGAVPAGTSLALLYLQHAKRDRVQANGNRVGDGDLSSDIGILRVAHFIKLGPFTADPQILLPFGRLKGSGALDGLGDTDGVGDLILASGIWLVNKPEEGRYFGLLPGIYVPVGGYDRNRALNLGENRWKYLLQAGWVTPIADPKLSLQLTGDVTLFGRNDDYGAAGQALSQRPLYQFQAWLRYQLTPELDLRVGTSHSTGGRTKVDGVENDDRIRSTNFKLGASWNFAPSWNLVGLIGRDASVHNGLQESSRVNLRLMKAF